LGSSFWNNSIFTLPNSEGLLIAEFGVPFSIKLMPVIFSIIGGSLSFIIYLFYSKFVYNIQTVYFKNIYIFLSKKWYFDKIYNDFIVQRALNFGYRVSYKQIDRGIVEIFGP